MKTIAIILAVAAGTMFHAKPSEARRHTGFQTVTQEFCGDRYCPAIGGAPAVAEGHSRKTATRVAGRRGKRALASPAATIVGSEPRSGMVVVQTAAGIPIQVASAYADRFQGLISDLVASGYRPRTIHCHATGGHVRNSNHYRGAACDIDQRGWNRTAGPMYRVAGLAAKWGLRDGCSFRDCGHVDVPQQRWASASRRRVVARVHMARR